MTVKSKCSKVMSILIVMLLLSMSLISLYGCTKHPEDYSIDEHIEMISQRVRAEYIERDDLDCNYESFAVYPLYDENEELTHFLVEFEPCGFLLLKLHDEPFSILQYTSMYIFDDRYMESGSWRKYRYGTEDCSPESFNDFGVKQDSTQCAIDKKVRYFELSEDGEFVNYQKSPYAIANVLEQKLYCIGGACAVKENGKYLNLVSMLLYDEDAIKYTEFLPLDFPAGSIRMF